MLNMKKQCEICILNYSLSLVEAPASWASAAFINHRLCPDKRKYLALFAILPDEPDKVVEVAEIALHLLKFEMPTRPFSSPTYEAQWCSERASPYKLELYATHCFLSISEARQRDFAQYAKKYATNG